MTEFFEDNGGGIHAIIKDDAGEITNVITGFQHEAWDVGALLSSAMCGFDGADDYDPDNFSGVPMQDAADEIAEGDVLIAEIAEREIRLYPQQMGLAGKHLFGLDGD